jgi:hypothetical protein
MFLKEEVLAHSQLARFMDGFMVLMSKGMKANGKFDSSTAMLVAWTTVLSSLVAIAVLLGDLLAENHSEVMLMVSCLLLMAGLAFSFMLFTRLSYLAACALSEVIILWPLVFQQHDRSIIILEMLATVFATGIFGLMLFIAATALRRYQDN